MIPKRPIKQEENVDAWLMSYADMITLLLCFFIIFVSVSEPKRDELTRVTEGISGKFGAVAQSTPFVDVTRKLHEIIEQRELYKDVAVDTGATSLAMELATHRFFQAGGADLDPEMQPMLTELITALKQEDFNRYQINIESHTDDTPPQSGLYKDNWELSAVRAAKLASIFIAQGLRADHLKAIGYGDSRPKVPNHDAAGRPIDANRARNQRITITIEHPG